MLRGFKYYFFEICIKNLLMLVPLLEKWNVKEDIIGQLISSGFTVTIQFPKHLL